MPQRRPPNSPPRSPQRNQSQPSQSGHLQERVEVKPQYFETQLRGDTFNSEDRTVEIIWAAGEKVRRRDWMVGAFVEELSMKESAIRMTRLKSGAMSLLNSHMSYDMGDRLGVVLADSIRIQGGKAFARVKISRSDSGESLVRDLQDGMPFAVSVGYRIHAYEETEGQGETLPHRLITDWEPLELSAVPVPADPAAHSRSAETHLEPNECVVTRHIADNAQTRRNGNMKRNDLARTYKGDQLSVFATAYGVTRKDDETDDALSARLLDLFKKEDDAKAEAERAAAERVAEETARTEAERAAEEEAERNAGANDIEERVARAATNAAKRALETMIEEQRTGDRKRKSDIVSLAERFKLAEDDPMVRGAIENHTNFEDFREALLDRLEKEDGQINTNHAGVRNLSDMSIQRRDAAVEYLVSRPDRSATPSEAARQFRGMSLIRLAEEVISWDGVNTRGMTNDEIARRALSTGDFPIILSNLANKTLATAYDVAPRTFMPMVRAMNISDFKPRFIIRKGLAPQLEKKGEDGEYKYGTYAESKEQIKLITYGKAVRMTREMLINDDLGAFTGIAEGFGTSAATIESDIVWGTFLANPALEEDNVAVFHANHGNYATGAPTALSEAALSVGRVAMSKQKDLDRETTLNISPNFLIVPTELETAAEKLITGITPSKTDDVVPKFIRSLTLISDARLSNGISKAKQIDIDVTGSAKAWYLASSQVDNLVIAYMEGQTGVYTEEMIDFDTDGMKVKARHDFGAAWGDFRGVYKAKGEA